MATLTTGTLYALDKDTTRYEILSNRLKLAGATNVSPVQADFFNWEHDENVKFIVLDPSCSGSGLVTHQLIDQGKITYDPHFSTRRIRRLARFQYKMLMHALSFKHVHQVVYSTCSIYTEENENVVRKALKAYWRRYKLVKILPKWKRRGLGDYGECMVRTHPLKDKTQGFFVALIERRQLRLRHRLMTRRYRYWNKKRHLKYK